MNYLENIKELQEKIDKYLYDQMDSNEKNQFENSINNDNNFQKIIEGERAFRNFVSSNIKRPEQNPNLISEIKKKLNSN